jgi:hypothetical protein
MSFETTPDDFLRFLPTYLTNEEKNRLNQALEQFKEERGKTWRQKNKKV